MDTLRLVNLMEAVHDEGIRLEYVSGIPYWEMMPGARHHDALMAIWLRLVSNAESTASFGCFPYVELTLGFPDGSVKTPDLSIFCERPKEREGLVRQIPEAVVEIVSPGYERKDLEIGPPFYLAQGVRDVVVFDPRTNVVSLFQAEGNRTVTPPVEVRLECGCRLPITPVE